MLVYAPPDSAGTAARPLMRRVAVGAAVVALVAVGLVLYTRSPPQRPHF